MDIRSIIDSDSAPAKPASRQRSDAKLAYPQTRPVLHSQYEVQPSAYKGPREKRPPQPPPLQPPVHNDGRAPGALSHNPAQSPYQQSPSTARGGGQYLYSQHPIQSPVLGLQSSPYAQRESHLISTGNNYQAQSQPTSISPTSNATTPVALHAYPHQNRQSSSHSIPTPTSTQSQLPNMFSESPQASHPQIQTSSQSNSSQQYLSQPGTPLGPPSVFGRPPLLHRGSSGSYEHQRNHSGGSYGHQQAMASSPRKDALGSSGVSPLSGPRQFVSHSQSYQTKNEREQSLSVSPKTKLPGELHLHQLQDEIAAKFKNHSSLTSAPPKEDKSELYSPQGQSAIQSSNRSHSLGMKGILNMPKVNERTSNSGKSNSLTRSSLSEISNQDLKTPTRSESLLLPTLGISSTPHASQEPKPQPQQFSPHQQSSQIHAVPNWQSQAIPKSLTKLQTPSIAQTPTISYPATPVQTNPLPIPPTAAQTPQVSLSPASVQTSPASLPPPPPPPLPAAAASSLQTPSLSVPISSAVVQTPPVSIASAYIQTAMHSSMPADTTVHQTAIKQQGTAAVNLVGSPSPLVRRRRRHDEPPIWARSARQFKRVATGYSNASNKRHLATKSTMQATQDAGISRAISAEPPLLAANPTVAKQVKLEANGYALQTTENPISRIHSAIADPGLLGPWETNILNTIPSEETIRAISDFLYTEVVGRPDVGSGPAGGGSSKGAILEIEAKIGQLIDKNTNNRLRLPIVTECVLDKQDPNLRVAFKSSMTEVRPTCRYKIFVYQHPQSGATSLLEWVS